MGTIDWFDWCPSFHIKSLFKKKILKFVLVAGGAVLAKAKVRTQTIVDLLVQQKRYLRVRFPSQNLVETAQLVMQIRCNEKEFEKVYTKVSRNPNFSPAQQTP